MPFKWKDWRTQPTPLAENTPRVAGYVLNNRLIIHRMFPGMPDSLWVVVSGGIRTGVLPAMPLYAAKKVVEARYRFMLIIARNTRTRGYLSGVMTRDVS